VTPRVVLLLDNHHGPDRRAAWVSSAIREAGASVRIVAWDRRPAPGPAPPPPAGEEVVRIRVPAAWGAGRGTVAALARFSARVLAHRRSLLRGADVLMAGDVYLLPLARLLAATARIPLIYDAREDWAALEAARFPPRMLAAVTRAETALARGAAAVVVPGEARAERWRRVGIEPIVLRNVGTSRPRPAVQRWDVACAGLMAEQRRPDLVLALARARPDLRVVITGGGRLEDELRADAAQLPNVEYLGWVDDVDAVLAASRVIVYGEDPSTPYSALASPSTLYQAIRLRRPLVFYCGGEPEDAAGRFAIGVRCAPDVGALSAAVDRAREGNGWEFAAAWEMLGDGAERSFQARLRELLP
jgi:hypothetical protein